MSREGAAPAGIGDFEVTPREGGHAHDLPFLPIPIDSKRVAAAIPVRDLNFDLKRLQAAHDDNFHGTRTARSYALAQAADTLHELGFKGLRATGLRRKHIVALVREWKCQGRSIGTMKSRTAHIRWWAKRIDRPGVVPSNGELGITNREYVTNQDRSAVLDPEKLARVKDPHVAMARRLVGSGALIPSERNYRQQLEVYESQTRAAGPYRMHGLRHGYALERYEEITGWTAPAAGGPPRRSLTGARRRIDTAARRSIAEELGHSRLGVAGVYLGA